MTSLVESPSPANGGAGPEAVDPCVLADAVRSALFMTEHGWLRQIDVTTEHGRIVLRGTVPSYYLKQMAQVTVLGVSGVRRIRNELKVEGGRP